jgi:serine protease inhibitor
MERVTDRERTKREVRVCVALLALWAIGVAPARAEQEGPSALAAVAQSTNAFGADIYRSVSDGDKKRGNVFFSPASLALALSMASGGGRGETAAAFAKVLHQAEPAGAQHAA